MGRWLIKYFIWVYIVVYSVVRLFENDYYEKDSLHDEIFLFVLIMLCIFYFWSQLIFIMSPSKIKKLGDDSPLEYKITTGYDSSVIKHVYVRPICDLFWKELDYCFTVREGCEIRKANLFAEKVNTGKKMKKFVENRINSKSLAEKDMYINDVNSMAIIFSIITIFFFSIYTLSKIYY